MESKVILGSDYIIENDISGTLSISECPRLTSLCWSFRQLTEGYILHGEIGENFGSVWVSCDDVIRKHFQNCSFLGPGLSFPSITEHGH